MGAVIGLFSEAEANAAVDILRNPGLDGTY